MPESKTPRINVASNTPDCLSVPEGAQLPLSAAAAAEVGRAHLGSLSQQMGLPATTVWYVIQRGKLAFRPDEPAKIVSFANFDQQRDQPAFCAVVQYADTGPFYVDMHLPQYAMGKHPPLLLDRKNAETEQWERRSDRSHWLELVPESCIRKSYRLKS